MNCFLRAVYTLTIIVINTIPTSTCIELESDSTTSGHRSSTLKGLKYEVYKGDR